VFYSKKLNQFDRLSMIDIISSKADNVERQSTFKSNHTGEKKHEESKTKRLRLLDRHKVCLLTEYNSLMMLVT
jgi:hypothetical protein